MYVNSSEANESQPYEIRLAGSKIWLIAGLAKKGVNLEICSALITMDMGSNRESILMWDHKLFLNTKPVN